MDVEYFQYIIDEEEQGENAVTFDPEDAAAALFNCKLSDSFSNSSWSTNETIYSSFGNNSSVFEDLDFSGFVSPTAKMNSADIQPAFENFSSLASTLMIQPPALTSTPLPLSQLTETKSLSLVTDPMASVRLDHFYTTRVAVASQQELQQQQQQQLLPPHQDLMSLSEQTPVATNSPFLLVGGMECPVRRYSSRGRPAKTAIEKFIQLCIRGIPGVERVHWEAELEDHSLKYICKLCSRQFGLAYSLKQHIRFVHMKVRPFPCESCDKKFRSMYDLRRHSTLHTRERFVCVGCGTAYCSKQRVIAHIRKQCSAGSSASISKSKESEGDQYAIDRSLSVSASSPSPSSSISSSSLTASAVPPQIPDLWS